ncbi:MAG: hypothetical protein KDB02_11190 [Acidimicrobiales bacterium]|nr:hypothetical protein [Acidimicrobiales bacterium]
MQSTDRHSPTRVALVVLSFLALLAVGCGVSSNDDATPTSQATVDTTAPPSKDPSATTRPDGPSNTDDTTTTTDEETSTTSDDTTVTTNDSPSVPDDVREQLIGVYMGIGLTRDQSACLADKILGSGATNPNDLENSQVVDWMEACDISMSDLSKLEMPSGG